MYTRIKICCIRDIREAENAIRYGASAIGLVAEMPSGPGPIADDLIRQIAAAMPSVKIVQVIHVIGETSVEEAVRVSGSVDAILLDSGNPDLKVKELGGTGRIHNWKLSRMIREHVSCPVFLAGGLKPENVREAIETVEPYAVDVCSGVRTNGLLDLGKLGRFMGEVQRAARTGE